MKLGMNLSTPHDSNTFVPFTDLRICNSGWYRTPPGWTGWRAQLPPATRGQPSPETFPATVGYARPGPKTLACDGTGTLLIRTGLPGGQRELKFGDGGQPSYEVELPVGGGHKTLINVIENGTSYATCLQNLQLLEPGVRPGLQWQRYWDSSFLDSMRPWTGPLRTLDWVRAINGPATDWGAATHGRMTALDQVVDLANRTGKDLWHNLPVRLVTEAGIGDAGKQLGAYLAAYCDPARTIYVELGDEFWNGGSAWSVDRTYLDAFASKLCSPATGAAYGFKGWPGAVAFGLHHLVADIKSQIDPAKGPQVKMVVAGQCTYYANGMVDSVVSWLKTLGSTPDAIACAPYGCWPNSGDYTTAAVAAKVAAGDVPGAVDLLVGGLKSHVTGVIVPKLATWHAKAQQYGVPLYYYEMGLEWWGIPTRPDTAPAWHALIYDPRGAELVRWYLDQVGPLAEMGCWYSDCRPGEYGSRQHADDTSNCIRSGLLDWIAAQATPAVTP